MTDDPKTVAADIAQELRQHPERWTRGCEAKDQYGDSVEPDCKDAVCWCLVGFINKRDIPTPCMASLSAEFRKRIGSNNIGKWNDAAERTVDDLIALCESVANG